MSKWLINPETKLKKEDGENTVKKVKEIIKTEKPKIDSLAIKLENDFKRKTDSINNIPIPAPDGDNQEITPEREEQADKLGL
jgi:hypothetical protein